MTQDDFAAPPGWTIHHFGETYSTNDLAREAGEAGTPERSVFVADHQTRGRGRMGRSWLEERGSSLLFSILFRRRLSETFFLTMLSSVAAAEAIDRVAGVQLEIKWPNDLMLQGRKLAGVLTETNWHLAEPFAVVGMGINLNFDPSGVEGIPDTATSLLRVTGRRFSRAALLYEILLQIDSLLGLDAAQMEPVVRSRWATRLWRQRQKVAVVEGNETLEGVFDGVAEDGALILRLDDGSLKELRVGDLVI